MKKKEGFTLVELLVVMAIVAVLNVLIVGAIRVVRNVTQVTQTKTELRDIGGLLDFYKIKFRDIPYTYPPDESSWTNVITALKDVKLLDDSQEATYSYDVWGTPYAYGYNGTLVLCSPGPDKLKGDNGVGTYGSGDDICLDDIEVPTTTTTTTSPGGGPSTVEPPDGVTTTTTVSTTTTTSASTTTKAPTTTLLPTTSTTILPTTTTKKGRP